ncbi:unnamed protein product, partial [Ascophyllum nodosum]
MKVRYSARVSALPDLKECMVNAVRSPALRACIFSAFVVSGAGMDVFPPELMGAPVFGRLRVLGKRYLRHVPAQRSPYCNALRDCSYGTCGHTLINSAVLYRHEVIGAVSHRLP